MLQILLTSRNVNLALYNKVIFRLGLSSFNCQETILQPDDIVLISGLIGYFNRMYP